jgi:glycosyltransferase involved in cell wall biosynthesis
VAGGTALQWFASEGLPRVVSAIPWVRLRVTGARPPREALSVAGPHVDFLGFVPDIAALYDRALVAIAPIRFGAGVKIKTLEAMQYGVPVVATRIGAEGLGTGVEEAIDIVDDPASFAEFVITLLTDEEKWKERRRSMAAHVRGLRELPRRSWAEIIDGVLCDAQPSRLHEQTKYRSEML